MSIIIQLSVTLVDWDHTVHQKVEIVHDKIDRCLGYLHAEVEPGIAVSRDPEFCSVTRVWSRSEPVSLQVERMCWSAVAVGLSQ